MSTAVRVATPWLLVHRAHDGRLPLPDLGQRNATDHVQLVYEHTWEVSLRTGPLGIDPAAEEASEHLRASKRNRLRNLDAFGEEIEGLAR